MFKFSMVAAATLFVASAITGHAHESSPAPPPPKQESQSLLPVQVILTNRGTMLTDLNGKTLYYFDRDDSGTKSNCNNECTKRWIPFAAPTDATAIGDFTVITRDDGSKMWAYCYRPLYTSEADKAPGEINGFDPSNEWHVARPLY
jgi:predicted lipoprotein with Yx(FWY)xxD motif